MNPLANNTLHNFFCDSKIIKGRSLRPFFQTISEEQRREEILDKVLIKNTKNVNANVAFQDDDAVLAESLKEFRRTQFLESKRRQQLRENNHELIDLERKLRSAYVSKALSAQKAEHEALINQEKALKHHEDKLLEKARIGYEEHLKMLDEAERKKKEALRNELKAQMHSNTVKKAKIYAEFIEEKNVVNEIVRKVYDEQLEAMRARQENKIKIQNEMKQFEEYQLMHKKSENQNSEAENIKNEASLLAKEERKKTMETNLRNLIQHRATISEKIGKEITKVADEKRKRIDVLEDLLIEERNAGNDQKFREDMDRKNVQRNLTRLELDRHREDNVRRLNKEKEEEVQYRVMLMNELADRDKLEQLSNERRRKKMLEHRRDIEQILAEKKRRRAEELTGLLKLKERNLKREEDSQKLIEEERIRLLKDHAPSLLGFLPVGVLRESDREHFGFLPKQ